MSFTSEIHAGALARSSEPVEGVLGAIGNTPLMAMRRYLSRPDIELWAKLEAANPGGSSKDRPAARMLQNAFESGSITPGATVIESGR